MHARIVLIATTVILGGLLGCGGPRSDAPRPGGPPLGFSFRKSKVPAQGMVLGIRNTSSAEELDGIVVSVRSLGEASSRSHRVETSLRPEDTITVGWVELDGWKLKPGDEVTIKCRQYQAAKTINVPKP